MDKYTECMSNATLIRLDLAGVPSRNESHSRKLLLKISLIASGIMSVVLCVGPVARFSFTDYYLFRCHERGKVI